MGKALSAPVSLWAFAAMSTGTLVVHALRSSLHPGPAIFSIIVILLWNAGLLNGARWLWVGTVVLLTFFVLLGLAKDGIAWFGDLTSLLAICLLVVPSTRRFFKSGESIGST